MSTPTVPTKPDVPAGRPAPERREGNSLAPRPEPRRDQQQGVSPPPGPAPSDRAVDADLLIDIPQLSVEALTLELDASLLLNRVKLDAKGLEASLYLKADFEHLVALAQQNRASAGGAYRDMSDRNGRRHPFRDRARRFLTQGAKAAGVTAAGVAGGALLDSQGKQMRKLPMPGRKKRTRAIRDAIAKRLP